MKKYVLSLLSFAFGFCLCYSANAKVVFLAKDTASIGAGQTNDLNCEEQGYTYTSSKCSNGLAIPCPTNSNYFKVCCPEGYKYTREECVSNARPLSVDNCYGYYKCDSSTVTPAEKCINAGYNVNAANATAACTNLFCAQPGVCQATVCPYNPLYYRTTCVRGASNAETCQQDGFTVYATSASQACSLAGCAMGCSSQECPFDSHYYMVHCTQAVPAIGINL